MQTILSPSALDSAADFISPYGLATLMSSRSLGELVDTDFDPQTTGVAHKDLAKSVHEVARIVGGLSKKNVAAGEGLQKTLDWIDSTTVEEDNSRQLMRRLGVGLSERSFIFGIVRNQYRQSADAFLAEARKARIRGEGIDEKWWSREQSREILDRVYLSTIDHLRASAWNASALVLLSAGTAMGIGLAASKGFISLPYFIVAIPFAFYSAAMILCAYQNWAEVLESREEVERILAKGMELPQQKSWSEKILGDSVTMVAISAGAGVVAGGALAVGLKLNPGYQSIGMFSNYLPSVAVGVGVALRVGLALKNRARDFLVAGGHIFENQGKSEGENVAEINGTSKLALLGGALAYLTQHVFFWAIR